MVFDQSVTTVAFGGNGNDLITIGFAVTSRCSESLDRPHGGDRRLIARRLTSSAFRRCCDRA